MRKYTLKELLDPKVTVEGIEEVSVPRINGNGIMYIEEALGCAILELQAKVKTITDIIKIVWCLMRQDMPDLDIHDVGAVISMENMQLFSELITKAFAGTPGMTESTAKNLPAAHPPKRSPGRKK